MCTSHFPWAIGFARGAKWPAQRSWSEEPIVGQLDTDSVKSEQSTSARLNSERLSEECEGHQHGVQVCMIVSLCAGLTRQVKERELERLKYAQLLLSKARTGIAVSRISNSPIWV